MRNIWSWLIDWIGGGKPKPPVIVVPPATYTVRVEVFEGDPSADEKIPGATVTLGSLVETTGGSGDCEFQNVSAGTYTLLVEAPLFTDVAYNVTVPHAGPVRISMERKEIPQVELKPLSVAGKIFHCDGQPWRWKGVTAFKLLNKHASGEDITPFLNAYKGFNMLRIFGYTEWDEKSWEMPTAQEVKNFCAFVAQFGFYVELVLLTSDEAFRAEQAKQLVRQLTDMHITNLVFEIGNEPLTHKDIDTTALRSACEASGYLYSNGVYEDSKQWFGKFGTAHTPRDDEWPRKAHDLLEYYNGGGPNSADEPACKVPWVADEPIRPDQAGGPTRSADVLGYFGTASVLGAGGTVHTETGKYGLVPTGDEQAWADLALHALNTFAADAPNGSYKRVVENSLRTYIVGPAMVRVRPTTPNPPEEAGWMSQDDLAVLWKR